VIERFNFYDVFGFFIPGSVLLLLLWLPFGIARGSVPPSDLTSALVTVIVSYLTGHFMQAWANRAFPLAERGRYPSSRMLDAGDRRFASKRDDLVRLFKEEFGIDVEPADKSVAERVRADDRRDVAFLLARQRLIARKRVGYAEQFEGLYTMMRGIMLAAMIGAVYLFGWIASPYVSVRITAVVLGILIVAVLIVTDLRLDEEKLSTPERRDQEYVRALAVVTCILGTALFAGAGVARRYLIADASRLLLAFSMVAAAALAIQTAASYRYYSGEFAKAVYRGFLELQTADEEKDDDDD
jgi:hypothetical protein